MSRNLYESIVVAVNGSSSSIHAAMYGIILAKHQKLSLKFVYVVDTATIKRLSLSHFLVSDESSMYEKNLQNDGERYIDYAIKLAKNKGVKATGEIRKGSVCIEIVNCINETGADLLLLGGENSETVKTFAWENTHSSISLTNREIISNSPCSVIIVKERDIELLYSQLK
ncbi:MAG: universal stress protein [Treponema sp.]|uniref:universal stress protein n=1 Tax=Treponema sp. TaxID=166 RepID=UPI001B587947|nr:universal stress protein [Treponema sp.]MBP5401726.1 universal stress protein [Treponema sp.]MBR5932529.1 universal stress protein [Treponema sp.]